MNRRKVLLGSGTALTTVLAGCSNDETEGENGEDNGDENGNESENGEETGTGDVELPDQPEISTEDINPDDAATSLTISWNATVFDAMSYPGEDWFYESDEGEQYLILAKEIENTGDEETSFATGALEVVADGEEAEWTAITEASGVSGSIPAGETIEGRSAFKIVEGAEAVSITVSPALGSYAATFEHDDSIEIPFEPIEPDE